MDVPTAISPHTRPPVVFLIAERFGENGGGEAIKAYQYARHLQTEGYHVVVFTHARSVQHMGGDRFEGIIRTVEDTTLQRLLWRSRLLRFLLQPYFHLQARNLALREYAEHPEAIFHYISPVSPVAPRFAPRGCPTVFGPMTGNIYYPPGFRARVPLDYRLREMLHTMAQRVLGRLFPEKKRALCLLVSGYERTRASLELAGCPPARMLDVVDSGVNAELAASPRITHQGINTRFVLSGRIIDHKGIDLAIKALPHTQNPISLDIFGDGPERLPLERLTETLGLGERVSFKGWVRSHEDLVRQFRTYRGYVFPSLAEANGIVMQEAMMVGLPVITLRWGGPAHLAPDDGAIFVEPRDEDYVCRKIAQALDLLAQEPERADAIAERARAIAEARFTWSAVAESWAVAYRGMS